MSESNGAAAQEFVLDCCVVMAWFFADEQDAYAEEVLAVMSASKPVIPQHWHLEIANTIRVGERRRRCTESQSSEFLAKIDDYHIVIDAGTADAAWGETLRLARLYNLASYDAAYLELALRLKLPLATIDQPLAKAAALAGVTLFQPLKPTP